MVYNIYDSSVATVFITLLLCTTNVRSNSFNKVQHPMLYFNEEDLQQLIHKSSFTHAKIFAYIHEAARAISQDPNRYLPSEKPEVFSSVWNEHFGNNLCMLSMYCVLHPEDDATFKVLTKYMDRMASYPDWYVGSSRGKDQVPIGHSLTGFSTAYDFLYRRFSKKQQDIYYYKIKNTTEDLYKLFKIGRNEWAVQYIHNHAPSNLVAFLLGSLVVSNRDHEVAVDWLTKVKKHLDFAMELFSYVIDGSVDEGVSYGSYTSRGLTQYVYLAKRHFGVDHSDNPWLHEHFWFFYHTLLPGYQRTVGIGDTNYHWFYGPESQILFLETFVLKNGYGNWLSDRIRSSRSRIKPLAQSTAQIWSTFHTEFLFYNASLPSVKPRGLKKMHIFSDWGVVTYGGGQDMVMGNTFFSFKSGLPNGEAVQDIIQSQKYPEWIAGWRNFNAGHEHPDQNSFVFVPNGRYVISESLYGPKMTHLDNTVVFAPSSTSKCNQPWEGQLGECDKWLNYKLYDKHVRGEILTAVTSGQMAFVAGEAVRAYHKSLKLSSVFRAILLMNPEVLAVVDTIRLLEGSKTTTASFLFHNTWTKFQPHECMGFNGAKVEYPEGSYSVITVLPDDEKSNITLHEGVQPSGLREGPTNVINVTVPLREQVTNVVHIFSGPNYVIKSLKREQISKRSGVSLTIKVNDQTYSVKVSTSVKSDSRQFEPSKERKRITGFGGFAQVKITNDSSHVTHYFGLDRDSYNDGYGTLPRPYLVRHHLDSDILSSLPRMVPYTSSFDKVDVGFESFRPQTEKRQAKIDANEGIRLKYYDTSTANEGILLIVQSAMFLFVIIGVTALFKTFGLRSHIYFTFRKTSWHIPCVLAISTVLLNCYCLDVNGKNICFSRNSRIHYDDAITQAPYNVTSNANDAWSPAKLTIPTTPFVMLTSLPGSGADLLEKAFEDSNMTTYLTTRNLNIPVQHGNARGIDLCLWISEENQRLHTMGWFNSLKTKTILHFNQRENAARMKNIRQRLRENINSPIVLNDNCGFWMTKLPWVKNIIGKEDFQPILVVRDPRSWIYTMLKSHSQERSDSQISDLVKHLERIDESCNALGTRRPFYLKHFQTKQIFKRTKYDEVEKLAIMWTVATGSALVNMASEAHGSWPVHIIRFEDLLMDPETSTSDMFAKLGLPLGVKSLNKVIRTVKSGHYTIPHDGVLDSSLLNSWMKGLSLHDIRKIESICSDLLDILDYQILPAGREF